MVVLLNVIDKTDAELNNRVAMFDHWWSSRNFVENHFIIYCKSVLVQDFPDHFCHIRQRERLLNEIDTIIQDAVVGNYICSIA